MPVRVIHLEGFDPAENLAREEAILADLQPDERALIFYTNRESVICGKNQNPWLEADIDYINGLGAQLFRRKSGGGTVWHDTGNLNYSFLSWRSRFDSEENHQILINALARFGIRSEKTARGDLLAQGRKFSGNAYWYQKDRVLHHGTLLIDADLERLQRALQGIAAKGLASVTRANRVESRPSRTVNLRDLDAGIDALYIIEAVAEELGVAALSVAAGQPLQLQGPVDLDGLVSQYRTWEWNFGRTHSFELGLAVRHGAQDTHPGLQNVRIEVIDGFVRGGSILLPTGQSLAIEPLVAFKFEGEKSIRALQQAVSMRPSMAPEGWRQKEGVLA